jgi:hypothetical protein
MMKHGMVGDVLMWILIGSLAVLVIMHRKGFSSAISSISNPLTQESQIFTGAGYGNASGGQYNGVGAKG